MIWEKFTDFTDIDDRGDPNKLIGRLSEILRSIDRVGGKVVGYCHTEAFGSKPPENLDDALDIALKIAGGEVILSQLATYLAKVCAVALNNGIQPTQALKERLREDDGTYRKELFESLDEYGLIYKAYKEEERLFLKCANERRATSGEDISYTPTRMTWNLDNDLAEATTRFTVARETFENSRSDLIGKIINSSTVLRSK